MPAREQQEEIGVGGRRVGDPGEGRGQRMGFEVVDRDEGQAAGDRQPLAEAGADDQPADQPRPGGGGDARERVPSQPGAAHHPGGEAGQMRQMGAGGDLRDHPAEAGMLGLLGQNRLRQDGPIRGEHRGGGLVAA